MRLSDPPLGEAFAAAMAEVGPWGRRPIAVAVSGGADSVALALLAGDWCRESGRGLLVITVDHGLRAQALGEVRGVAALAARFGVPCRIVTIQGR